MDQKLLEFPVQTCRAPEVNLKWAISSAVRHCVHARQYTQVLQALTFVESARPSVMLALETSGYCTQTFIPSVSVAPCKIKTLQLTMAVLSHMTLTNLKPVLLLTLVLSVPFTLCFLRK